MRCRWRLICLFCVAMIFTGCEGQKPSSQRLFYLTAPTNIWLSSDGESASYDGILLDLSSGEQKKIGQVEGATCFEWSDENQLFMRVVQNHIHLFDQDLQPVNSLSLEDMNIKGATWVPNGNRIVFYGENRNAPYGRQNLYTMNKDGTDVQKVAFDENQLSRSSQPAVSWDGKQVAFVSNRDFDLKPGGILDFDIYLTWFHATEVIRLTKSGSDERDPAWSPDGKYLAFTSNIPDTVHDSLVYNIFLIDLENQSITQLTHNSNSFFGSPQWTPDGKEIAYTHQRMDLMQPQNETIALVSMDGKTTKEIPCKENFSCFCPQWIP